MTGPFEADDAATPLTPVERDGLILTHVTLKGELNELEQKNIAEATGWAFERRRNVLDENFLRRLHRRMFNQVWRWAGNYRTTRRNIGVEPHLIQPQLIQAVDDAHYWAEHRSYGPDELKRDSFRLNRHARACRGHPRLKVSQRQRRRWPGRARP